MFFAWNNMHLPFAEIAAKLGHDDVSKLTPIDIALEVLKSYLFYGHQLSAATNFLFSFRINRSLCTNFLNTTSLSLCSRSTRSRALSWKTASPAHKQNRKLNG